MSEPERIILAHGGGGELTKALVEGHVLPRLGNATLRTLTDAAALGRRSGCLCFTTDSFVVQPLEFPGGDIGRLAVCGTVNDLAMMGAMPIGLSLALIIEEGLDLRTLDRMLDSVARAAAEAGVEIVTGDTKVVERGRGDGLMINTAGVGEVVEGANLGADRIRPGDRIVVTGRLAEHGLAVMSAREGLAFDTDLVSDVAPLNGLVQAMLASGADIRFLRDPTRAGVAGVLADLCEATGLTIEVRESDLPLSATARQTAEMLGLDPLTVANEGNCVAVVAEPDVERLLGACRAHPRGRFAAEVGAVVDRLPALVELVCRSGGRRIVQRPYGEELPRIC
ncbi:MAG: hydrogenase expression/formation protein HypE [Lentisphaerae bacterium RIFOXYB12_FULL_65_16]|nr:MAG: hydrogenase expression/formation protein HypE [Lentisphaerae bacterium RIFOXYB12_FULL_65_16]